MFKSLEGARLGLFIFIGTIILIIVIFLVGSKESLFVKTIEIKAYFDRIEGLKPGAPVRLSGYDIGSVSSISLADVKTGQVEVHMRIKQDLIKFIRLDSQASIETEGLVGKKIVSITPGSVDLPIIEDGGTLKTKTPINISEIVEETKSVMANLQNITKDFADIVNKVNVGEGTIGKLINDDQLYYATVKITNTADKSLDSMTLRLSEISNFIIGIGGSVKGILSNVDSAVADVKNLTDKINRGQGMIGALISDKKMYDSLKTIVNNLVLTSENTLVATSRFAENMEALKHNWLFKGYFEQRGYWDELDYEKNINSKLQELKSQNQILDQKIKELKEIESRLNIKK
ncbi:MlaD family protein [Melioribacteraceae bacterium 4301-Me]|uniref:MlaD family protein n=1 Tax=Pyranulibacter aquaticus TaxID=3163344 RepID=UPI003598B8D9